MPAVVSFVPLGGTRSHPADNPPEVRLRDEIEEAFRKTVELIQVRLRQAHAGASWTVVVVPNDPYYVAAVTEIVRTVEAEARGDRRQRLGRSPAART